MKHLTGITWLPVFFTLVFMAFFSPVFSTLSEAADAPNNREEKTGKHRVVIVTDPYKSMVEILDSSVAYTPGIALPDGKYKIRVSHVGYVSETGSIVVDGRDVSALVILKELPTPEGGGRTVCWGLNRHSTRRSPYWNGKNGLSNAKSRRLPRNGARFRLPDRSQHRGH
ncbi:MAG: hypothetical protein HQL07_01510 [Nitrospirae bacterium]|nr:hypothetical protein [Magnetococcales bacterium]